MTVARPEGTREVPVPGSVRDKPSLNDEQIQSLARMARTLEQSQERILILLTDVL